MIVHRKAAAFLSSEWVSPPKDAPQTPDDPDVLSDSAWRSLGADRENATTRTVRCLCYSSDSPSLLDMPRKARAFDKYIGR